jgi:UDP-N-acetylmuramoylalanine--D-glutamate ligase
VITCSLWRGKRYAVLGLARSGLATVEALLASGAEVVAWDSNEVARVGLRGNDLLSFADPLTIVSPGVPLNRHPIAAHAKKYGVPIIGDIELFAQARAELPPHKVVGITGTNGKSTTTALIHHILQTAGVPSLMGGNIGLPILGRDPLPEGGVYVLELSSYQIDLTFTLDCDVAVLLNITPDHLDRYDGFEGYAASKARLFWMKPHDDEDDPSKIVVVDDPEAAKFADELHWVERVSMARLDRADPAYLSSQKDWPALQGPHNAQNAVAAIYAARRLGIDWTYINRGLRTYPGLPHRMERIRTHNGVLYVNDSKATNPEAVAPALAAYPAIHWILGGKSKGEDLGECAAHYSHVRAAYTIGDAGRMFAALLKPHMPVTESGTLDVAVKDAAGAARPGDTVLLSPACASFDQFKDFEARGDAFRALVEAL